MAKLARWLMALFALCVLGPAALGGAADSTARIVAVGDLHGDYDAFLDIVDAAGIADGEGNWTGGRTVFVQLGDVPDRGPDTLRIIASLQKLERQAPGDGGKVVVLVGNHEAMNVTGDLRYVSPGEYAAFADRKSEDRRRRLFKLNEASIVAFYKDRMPGASTAEIRKAWEATYPLGKIEHRLAWSPKGDIGRWVMSHPAIAKIDGTLFVHGGISVETAAMPIDDVNAKVREALAADEGDVPSILNEPHGPLWYRGNVSRAGEDATERKDEADPPSIDDELTQVLAAYGTQRLVVGHTPDLEGIVADEGGRLLRIDSGISAAYGGPRSYLELSGRKAVAWEKKGGAWTSRELPSPQAVTGQ